MAKSHLVTSNRKSGNVSAEKPQSSFKSASRYQIDQNLIAEEENDGSSFLVEERCHNQVDDNHS